MSAAVDADAVREACRLVQRAAADELLVRVLGGTAIAIHSPDLPAALRRDYQDIDLICTANAGRRTAGTMMRAGYLPNERFNALHGQHRQVYYDAKNGRQIDLFVGRFEMCHTLPLEHRLALDNPTVPLADLLLTKLQIHSLNQKDAADIASILVTHPVGTDDADTINGTYIAKLLAGDWGLWRTCTGTLGRIVKDLQTLRLDPRQQHLIRDRIEQLSTAITNAPKTFRWRTRARVGERARWYEEPDEIEHAHIGGAS